MHDVLILERERIWENPNEEREYEEGELRLEIDEVAIGEDGVGLTEVIVDEVHYQWDARRRGSHTRYRQ